jgi:hypothetical protein
MMTNSDLTLIAALLDRTGSMSSCVAATQDGFDELINSQKRSPSGDCIVTLAQFDYHLNHDGSEAPIPDFIYSNRPIAQVPKLILTPRGMTPLLDATGNFVTSIGESLAALPESSRPGLVICVIMTDGQENHSSEWTWDRVQALIKQQTETYKWKFMFLGANMDAVSVGARMGFTRGASVTYNAADYGGTHAVYGATAANISNLRAGTAAAPEFTEEDRKKAMGEQQKSDA